MAKGAHCKIKRRWRALRRKHIDQLCEVPLAKQMSQRLYATIIGQQYRQTQSKNAFLYPEDPTAVFPQHRPQEIIDLRSQAIPGSGLEWAGAYRKPQNETQQEMVDLGQQIVMEQVLGEEQEQEMSEERQKQPKVAQVKEAKRKRCSRSRRIVKF